MSESVIINPVGHRERERAQKKKTPQQSGFRAIIKGMTAIEQHAGIAISRQKCASACAPTLNSRLWRRKNVQAVRLRL